VNVILIWSVSTGAISTRATTRVFSKGRLVGVMAACGARVGTLGKPTAMDATPGMHATLPSWEGQPNTLCMQTIAVRGLAITASAWVALPGIELGACRHVEHLGCLRGLRFHGHMEAVKQSSMSENVLA